MNSDHALKVARLIDGKPIGNIAPLSNRYGKDEVGRVYKIQEVAEDRPASWRRDKRHFSFVHMRNIIEVTRNLSNKYCGYLLLLQPYITFKTNVLATQGRADTPLTITDIAAIWGVSKRTASAVLSEFETRSILFETSGRYTLNERYHFRKKAAGGDVDALIKTFFTTLRSFDMTAADLGFVYKLLPYVHYDTNLICEDPFAEPHVIRYLTHKEVGEFVGMAENKAKDTMVRLRKAGVIQEWVNKDDKRTSFTALNPYVFYRKPGEPDGMLAALFAKYKR